MFDVPELMYLAYLEEQEEKKNQLIELITRPWDEEDINFYNNKTNSTTIYTEAELKEFLLDSNKELVSNREYSSLLSHIRSISNRKR